MPYAHPIYTPQILGIGRVFAPLSPRFDTAPPSPAQTLSLTQWGGGEVLDAEPETLSPKPETLNPKP